MSRVLVFLILTSVLYTYANDTLESNSDIKFYNLEKEYRETITWIYNVKEAEALELKQVIQDMLSIYGSLHINEEANQIYITDIQEKISDLKTVIPRLDKKGIESGGNLVSQRVVLDYTNTSEVANLLRHKLSSEGTLNTLDGINGFIITDIPSRIKELKSYIDLVDVPVPHISVEITVVEFNAEDFSKLGIGFFNWLQGLNVRLETHGENFSELLYNKTGHVKVRSRNQGNIPEEDYYASNQQYSNEDYHFKGDLNISEIVNFLCENADGSVLAKTRVITRNNRSASVYSREEIPGRFYSNSQAYSSSYESREIAGTSIRVRPLLKADNLINLKIYPTVSSLSGWSPKGLPIVFQRSVNTEVDVPNDSIFVLGGLKKKSTVHTRKGIPGLKKVPVLRYFFSVKKDIVVERDVVVFIRPHVVKRRGSSVEYRETMEKSESGSDGKE